MILCPLGLIMKAEILTISLIKILSQIRNKIVLYDIYSSKTEVTGFRLSLFPLNPF